MFKIGAETLYVVNRMSHRSNVEKEQKQTNVETSVETETVKYCCIFLFYSFST